MHGPLAGERERERERERVSTPYIDELGGAEAADPEEAALGGALPEAGEEVERVGGGGPGLEPHQRAVVGGRLVGVRPQLAVRPVLLRGGAQPGHHLAVVAQPPLVLQVEQRGVCIACVHGRRTCVP